MECSKCGSELFSEDVEIKVAAHDLSLLDIIIYCKICNTKYNSFIRFNEFIEMEE